MPIDRELMRSVRSLDLYDLRRLQIFVRGLLHQAGEDSEPALEAIASPGKVSYRLEEIKCGKPGCSKCPHGPYWYAYWREGPKVRSKYIGRTKPEDA